MMSHSLLLWTWFLTVFFCVLVWVCLSLLYLEFSELLGCVDSCVLSSWESHFLRYSLCPSLPSGTPTVCPAISSLVLFSAQNLLTPFVDLFQLYFSAPDFFGSFRYCSSLCLHVICLIDFSSLCFPPGP